MKKKLLLSLIPSLLAVCIAQAVTVTVQLPADGSVSVSPAGGEYAAGDTVTFTASSDTREFVRWYGDLPEEQLFSPELTVTLTSNLTIAPYFSSNGWTYDASAKTITDGYWTFGATVTADNTMTVSSRKVIPGIIGFLDFSTPVDNGTYSITKLEHHLLQRQSQLTDVRLPDSLQVISEAVFELCTNLKTIRPFFPTPLNYIGTWAFANCPSLEGDMVIHAENGFQFVGEKNFSNRGADTPQITSIDFGPGVTNIPTFAFMKLSQLTNVVFRGPVQRIGQSAFEECKKLKTITPFLPDTVEYIGTYAFSGDTALEGDLRILADPFTFGGEYNFNRSNISSVTLGTGVKMVPKRCFRENYGMTNLVFLGDIEILGGQAFELCTSLASVTPFLPHSITNIGSWVFSSDTALEQDLELGKGKNPVTLVGSSHFYKSGITSIDIGPGITTLPQQCFDSCPNLTNVIIRGEVALGKYAFSSARSLQNVYLAHKPTAWEASFNNHATYTRFHLARGIEAWDDFVADPAMMIPWENVASYRKDTYSSLYPEGPTPIGLSTTSSLLTEGYVFRWSVPVDQNTVTTIFIR